MKKYRTRQRNRVIVGLASLLIIFAGLGLLGHALFGGASAVAGVIDASFGSVEAPKDTRLSLTVPKMERVENVPVYDAPASDNATLDKGAMHVRGTGFPWQPEANVYIAGHRLGYPGTGSYLQFYDLNELETGDEILLTDANGTRYTYEVFKKFVVGPDAYHVTEPIPGRNIVSLQTCTLPDYSHRLIVQGELVSVG